MRSCTCNILYVYINLLNNIKTYIGKTTMRNVYLLSTFIYLFSTNIYIIILLTNFIRYVVVRKK